MNNRKISDELVSISRRIARIDDGPIVSVLDRYGKTLTDLEHDLKMAKKDYNAVASYSGKGKADAEYIISEIDKAIAIVEGLSMKTFVTLSEKEGVFIKKWKTPAEYVRDIKEEIAPK